MLFDPDVAEVFESNVVLEGSKTLDLRTDRQLQFESNVVLEGSKY